MIAQKKNLELILNLSPDLPLISTDQQKIARVLTSLLDNAIKFTDQGTISVTVKLVEEAIEVCIADTGIGIAETEFSKIFMRFYQIENSLNRRFEGIGLGLSIVKGIVERLGGRVWVTSQLKKGSQFYFTLPLVFKEPEGV